MNNTKAKGEKKVRLKPENCKDWLFKFALLGGFLIIGLAFYIPAARLSM
jgi:hypothetical protein